LISGGNNPKSSKQQPLRGLEIRVATATVRMAVSRSIRVDVLRRCQRRQHSPEGPHAAVIGASQKLAGEPTPCHCRGCDVFGRMVTNETASFSMMARVWTLAGCARMQQSPPCHIAVSERFCRRGSPLSRSRLPEPPDNRDILATCVNDASRSVLNIPRACGRLRFGRRCRVKNRRANKPVTVDRDDARPRGGRTG